MVVGFPFTASLGSPFRLNLSPEDSMFRAAFTSLSTLRLHDGQRSILLSLENTIWSPHTEHLLVVPFGWT